MVIYDLVFNFLRRGVFGLRPAGGGGLPTPDQLLWDDKMQLTTLVLTVLIVYWVVRGGIFMIGWIFKRIGGGSRYD